MFRAFFQHVGCLILLAGVVLTGGAGLRTGQNLCARDLGQGGAVDVCCTEHHETEAGMAQNDCDDCPCCAAASRGNQSERTCPANAGKSVAQESFNVPQVYQIDSFRDYPIAIGGNDAGGETAHSLVSCVVLRC